MGQRANLIVVRGNTYDLYYSHWCANTLPKDLFWGEQYAIQFIEMQTRVDESGWLDDVWAEGGAVMDVDKKKLVFYGGEDILYNIPLRNLYLKLMRKIWHGWEIDWAYEGIVDLAAYVGYPKEKVVKNRENDVNDTSLAPPEEKDWVDTVASVTYCEDETLLFPLCGGVEVYLSDGPKMIDKINKSYGYKTLSLSEWSQDFPVGGFHLDLKVRRLEFWHAYDLPNLSEQLSVKWSDWEVIDHYGNYELQCKRTDGRLLFQRVDQQQLLEKLKGLLLTESTNPLDTIAYIVKKETDEGRTVEISPYALRYNKYELPRNVREEILHYAIDHL
ncbi:hypothetical protein J31TS6_41160 [Brevibacillus reuszeri]|uniref:hypothetical protein n=1 Tax=Brevibacillus reuszeri TaxID=54915 RepID=UPI001B2BEB4D|nr:hypothetical protein [Brevibacillus reuszeri]GIO08088.1 hypothetical protein J31TS6_41160 [Brevibacillus reuszeri]